MPQIFRAAPFLAVLVLAGCASSASTGDIGYTLPGPGATSTTTTTAALPSPQQQITTAQAMTDVTVFIDPAALRLLSERERTEAASAQFNALQFGRTGAPRSWSGDRGATGQVLVGPPVNVNSLYCRDFTHTVSVGGQTFSKKGMACREVDGRWGVASAS
jgi:surface antigen